MTLRSGMCWGSAAANELILMILPRAADAHSFLWRFFRGGCRVIRPMAKVPGQGGTEKLPISSWRGLKIKVRYKFYVNLLHGIPLCLHQG